MPLGGARIPVIGVDPTVYHVFIRNFSRKERSLKFPVPVLPNFESTLRKVLLRDEKLQVHILVPMSDNLFQKVSFFMIFRYF